MESHDPGYEVPTVTLEQIALVRGMLCRGDNILDVAACMGLPPLVVAVIQRNGRLPDIGPAPPSVLPRQVAYATHPDAAEALRRLADAETALRLAGSIGPHRTLN
jgi:hypothetical protein